MLVYRIQIFTVCSRFSTPAADDEKVGVPTASKYDASSPEHTLCQLYQFARDRGASPICRQTSLPSLDIFDLCFETFVLLAFCLRSVSLYSRFSKWLILYPGSKSTRAKFPSLVRSMGSSILERLPSFRVVSTDYATRHRLL